MAQHKAVFGGEPVGAWIFPEHHMCPAGVLGALKILEALDFLDQTIEEFIETVPTYPQHRVKLECPNNKKQSVMKVISEKYQKIFKDVESVSTVDGVRLEMSNGWVLIRPSGTEPVIRITVEGRTQQDIKKIIEQAKQLVGQGI
jgi:phosphoglucosamine mutase